LSQRGPLSRQEDSAATQTNQHQAKPISMDKVVARTTVPPIRQVLIKYRIKNQIGDQMNHRQHHQAENRNIKNSIIR